MCNDNNIREFCSGSVSLWTQVGMEQIYVTCTMYISTYTYVPGKHCGNCGCNVHVVTLMYTVRDNHNHVHVHVHIMFINQ